MFTLGHEYTRDQIHEAIGGSKVSCLPTVDSVVVAVCLLKKLSPQAPEVVLCGQGSRTGPTSKLFASHKGTLPVFIKRAALRWEYQGHFSVVQSLSSGPKFERLIEGSGRTFASVSYVVLLESFKLKGSANPYR